MGKTVAAAVNSISVAIAGCGAVTAAGSGMASLQQAITTNVSALQRRELLVGKTSQNIVAGFVAEEIVEALRTAEPADAGSRAFLFATTALREAAQEAESVLATVPAGRRGFVLATTKANIEALDNLTRRQSVSAEAQRQIQPAFLAADLAARFDCRGPMQCVSAACISGLLALQQGAALIRRGQAEVVFVAGVDLISQFVLTGFNSLKSLDPEGCRPFDKMRFGLSLGEGAAAIVLAKSERLAAPRILLAGFGVSNDANHLTGPSRDGSGLALAVRRAFARAAVFPNQIDYINAHGTGTPYNDNMESLAFRSVFGDRVPPMSANKGIFGHTLGTAGILETAVCVNALRHELLPGTPRMRERDPVAPESLLAAARPATGMNRILKTNCGFGGTNAAVILERKPA